MLPTITFSGDAPPPVGSPLPSARELQAMGELGLDLRRAGRVALMNQIGMALGIPAGGWHGQARLFKGDDIRLADLFPVLVKPRPAQLIAGNLARAARYVQVNLMLVTVSAQREACRSLTATGTTLINSFHQGGLDFLDNLKTHIGLPRSITDRWEPAESIVNGETGHFVFPERIPAGDQLVAYAAVMSASFCHNFRTSLRSEFGKNADVALARASRLALLVWQAYTFLSPGGRPYHPNEPLRAQLNKHFGHRSALGFYAHRAGEEGRLPALDDILADHVLEPLEWFHSAKTRAAETIFLECLFSRARKMARG